MEYPIFFSTLIGTRRSHMLLAVGLQIAATSKTKNKIQP
jgi:hypothetical protein